MSVPEIIGLGLIGCAFVLVMVPLFSVHIWLSLSDRRERAQKGSRAA